MSIGRGEASMPVMAESSNVIPARRRCTSIFHDQNGVLRQQTDEHDKTYLNIDIVVDTEQVE